MSNPDDELDALMAEIINSDSDHSHSEEEAPESDSESSDQTPPPPSRHTAASPVVVKPDHHDESSSEEEEKGGGVTIQEDELDSLIADIESQDSRRIRPKTKDFKSVGARKTTARKKVTSTLDGDALDSILDEIQKVTSERVKENMNKLGWGVVSAERKFDLTAPRYALVGTTITPILIVTTNSGDRARVDPSNFNYTLNGMDINSSVVDNQDGSYSVSFVADELGPVQLNIDIFGERQFEWEIIICAYPDAKKCTAEAKPVYQVNSSCEIIIHARDASGETLKVGGAKFGIAFSGAGQLNEVALLDKMDGSYGLTFVPSAPGQYAIFLSLDGEDIQTTPVTFTVE